MTQEEKQALYNEIQNRKAMVVGMMFSIYKVFNWIDEALDHARQSGDKALIKDVYSWHVATRGAGQRLLDSWKVVHRKEHEDVKSRLCLDDDSKEE